MGCSNFYRNVVAFACGGAALASLIALGLLSREKIGKVTHSGKKNTPPDASSSPALEESGPREQVTRPSARATGDTGREKRNTRTGLKTNTRQSDVSSLARGKGCRPLLGPKCSEGRSFVEYGATNESNNGGSE